MESLVIDRLECCFSAVYSVPCVKESKSWQPPLWSLDEAQRTYWQLSLVQQQQPSTLGSCLYANAGLTQEACFLLSCWSCTAGFTSLYTTIQFDRNINCDDVVFLLLFLLSRTSTTNNEISLGSVVPINGGFTELPALVILFSFFLNWAWAGTPSHLFQATMTVWPQRLQV